MACMSGKGPAPCSNEPNTTCASALAGWACTRLHKDCPGPTSSSTCCDSLSSTTTCSENEPACASRLFQYAGSAASFSVIQFLVIAETRLISGACKSLSLTGLAPAIRANADSGESTPARQAAASAPTPSPSRLCGVTPHSCHNFASAYSQTNRAALATAGSCNDCSTWSTPEGPGYR